MSPNMSNGGDESRARIMADVRRGLGRSELSGEAKAKLQARLQGSKNNLIPTRADKPHDEQVNLFIEMAEGVQASVARVDGAGDVPGAVADYLAQNNLTSDIVMAPDTTLDAYPWAERPLLHMERRKAVGADQVSITAAEMAFAETGTLMLTSDTARPSTLNFLPDSHVVILRADQITGAYEEGWKHLRAQVDQGTQGSEDGFMPRTVNLVTGPSRTGDIEQTMQLGAHGPRRLHIIIVEK